VSRLMSAYIWCIVLVVFLFPWQSLLNSRAHGTAYNDVGADFKVPGALYTWVELRDPHVGARFNAEGDWRQSLLRWARFVGFPVVSVIMLLTIQTKSNRGLRQALGEENEMTIGNIGP
jgi:hypothetical protein